MLGAVPHRFFPAKGLEWRRSWGMDREGLSLQARFEVSKKYAAAYEAASKKDKGLILDQVVAVTGWNRGACQVVCVSGLFLGGLGEAFGVA